MNKGYICDICKRAFGLKINYDRHFPYCEFVHKSKKEQKNDLDMLDEQIPSLRELYKIVQTMALRIDSLEKENMKLKQFQCVNRKSVDLLQWLNCSTQSIYCPSITFTMWINTYIFPYILESLQNVFDKNIMVAMIELFEKAIESCDIPPIVVFDIRSSTTYIFKQTTNQEGNIERKWTTISNSDLDSYIILIKERFLVVFNQDWNTKHRDLTEMDDALKDKYLKQYKSIVSMDRMKDESLIMRVRQQLLKKVTKKYT